MELRPLGQVRMGQQTCLFSGSALYALPHVPLSPSKHVLQVTVPHWLSLSVSPISRLSVRLQFGPHTEVISVAARPHSPFMRKWPQPRQRGLPVLLHSGTMTECPFSSYGCSEYFERHTCFSSLKLRHVDVPP